MDIFRGLLGQFAKTSGSRTGLASELLWQNGLLFSRLEWSAGGDFTAFFVRAWPRRFFC